MFLVRNPHPRPGQCKFSFWLWRRSLHKWAKLTALALPCSVCGQTLWLGELRVAKAASSAATTESFSCCWGLWALKNQLSFRVSFCLNFWAAVEGWPGHARMIPSWSMPSQGCSSCGSQQTESQVECQRNCLLSRCVGWTRRESFCLRPVPGCKDSYWATWEKRTLRNGPFSFHSSAYFSQGYYHQRRRLSISFVSDSGKSC